MQQSEFVQTYGPLANDISSRTGLDPNVVLGLVAQETGWGNHVVGSNIFGISPGGNVAGYRDVGAAADAFVSLINGRYGPATKAPPDQQPFVLAQLGYNKNPGYADAVSRTTAQARTFQGPQSMPAAPDYNTPSASPPNASPPNPTPTNDDPVGQIIRKLQARPSIAPSREMPADPEPPQIAGGYVSPSGDYVPPQAVPGIKPKANASPLVSSTTTENPTETNDLVVSPFDQRYTPFNVLPLATNNQTGAYALTVPNMIASPLQSWAQMGNRLFQPYTPDSMRSVTPEQFASLAPGARPLRFGVTPPAAAPAPGAPTPPGYTNPNLHLYAPPEGQTPLNSKGWYLPPEKEAPPSAGEAAPSAANQPNQAVQAPPNMTADDVARISKTIASAIRQNAVKGVMSDVGDAAARGVIHGALSPFLGPFSGVIDMGYNLGKHYLTSRAGNKAATNLESYITNELSKYLPKQ